jgi:hypothetical protein
MEIKLGRASVIVIVQLAEGVKSINLSGINRVQPFIRMTP